ncbi:hypothetical protein [Rhodobacter ferrooxidans]|uniref:HEAT repeat domain-containing protein n=1 Tax=Rhodobacter ferrooxidans TaxID=371731 RepID=C8RX55_9RHOB|nr:hypothetical protein [Rhodobacter sp. SW2]EEW26580.1 hypothetical protein Rsw2DRAFT_0383 [Rhodobacter sp. SW2]
MKRLLLSLILLAWQFAASMAEARAIVVQTGEHDGFTRLALQVGGPVQWTMGRTVDGYELKLDRDDVRYDLSKVYDLIQKDRLAAIWVDPVSGNLRLGIGCACHAIPFEFRPGVIVIDLREGPPPEGSSFEMTLDGGEQPELTAQPDPKPQSRTEPSGATYDWRNIADSGAGAALPIPNGPAVPLIPERADLAPMRDALLQQMSQGAATGVVDMTEPTFSAEPAGTDAGPALLPQIRIGEESGFEAGTRRRPPQTLTAAGAECLNDERLDIANWGTDSPVAEQMALTLTGLTGEFDRPDPSAIGRAAKYYLYLGFGAEARQLLTLLDSDAEDREIWLAMAAILDDASEAAGPFAKMQVCDTAAALWSVLSMAEISNSGQVNSAAVLRTFSALPLHLRRHLGPSLAERLLAAGDVQTASSVSDAILRAPGNPGPHVELLEAELQVAMGDEVAGETALATLAATGGPASTEALIAQVETRVAQSLPIDPATVTALAALAFEHRGGELEPVLQRAYLLALAAAGDFDSAFSQLDLAPDAEADLWKILAEQGPESALLAHAVLPDSAAPVTLAPPLRRKIAERLLALGFADKALRWLPAMSDLASTSELADRLLAARAELQRQDARAALRLLAGAEGPDAVALRARAQLQLGNMPSAAGLFAEVGDSASAQRATRLSAQWQTISKLPDEPWAPAAALLGPSTEQGAALPGPLARGRLAVEESAAARETLSSLLARVPAVSAAGAPTN